MESVMRYVVEADGASISKIVAFGAMAWDHSTSRDVSSAHPEFLPTLPKGESTVSLIGGRLNWESKTFTSF